MNRATLLRLLAHPTALTGADVRALEELAETFPYCQTAHLLLAKAAHDQGSMLAGQRLRRAATYAADRAQLRHLIELETIDLVKAAPMVEAVAPAIAIAELAAAEVTHNELLPPALPAGSLLPDESPVIIPVAVTLEDKPAQQIGPVPISEATELDTPAPPAELVTTEDFTQPEQPVPDELPAQAPPIRPPAEAEAARQEFGLNLEEPAEIVAYQLPELEEVALVPPVATPLLPPFKGVADVAYAPGEGSRFGFCLVPLAASETSGMLLMPAASLPPASEFFAPDALLLAHVAAQATAQPPAPKAADLINSFLQRAPAPSRRRAVPPPLAAEVDEQPDLSVRSTRAVPDLASESLAKILVRQGKPEQAITIYERLMVKNPEKSAYFATQIDLLRPSA